MEFEFEWKKLWGYQDESQKEFGNNLGKLSEKWGSMSDQVNKFKDYFLNHKAELIKETMLC